MKDIKKNSQKHDQGDMLDDEEWALLLGGTSQETPVEELGTSRRKRKSQQCQVNNQAQEKRRKKE